MIVNRTTLWIARSLDAGSDMATTASALTARFEVPRVRFLPVRRSGRALSYWKLLGAELGETDYERFFDRMLELRGEKGAGIDLGCGLSGFLLRLPDGTASDGLWCDVGKSLVVDVD